MAGQNFERQENGLISLISKAYKKNGEEPFTLIDKDGAKITQVIGARKFAGRAASGSEPYTDVELLRDVPKRSLWKVTAGKKRPSFSNIVNLSNKGEAAPSVAGGGLSGLESILGDDFGKKLFSACVKFFQGKIGKKFKKGGVGSDLFIEIGTDYKEDILVGTENMGGPIHFMYVGPMEVKGVSQQGDLKGFPGWNHKKQELKVNGKLTRSVAYATKYDIFYRIRKRRIYQVLNFTAKDSKGNHAIFVTPDDIADARGKYNITKYKGHFGPPRSKNVSKGKGMDPGEFAWKESKGKRDMARRVVVSNSKPAALGSPKTIDGFIIYEKDEED